MVEFFNSVLEWSSNIEPIVDIIYFVIALIAGYWSLKSYLQRPQFIVGMPPNWEEQRLKGIPRIKIGRESVIHRFKHKNYCFAKKIRYEKERFSEKDYRSLCHDVFRSRLINIDKDGKCTISIIVENNGSRAARDYIMAIQIYNKKIHISDILTESLSIDSVYASKPELIENKDVLNVSTDRRIISAYKDYMGVGKLDGDIIVLHGDLESEMYELISIKLIVEKGVNEFIIGYVLDCSDFWISKEAYMQGFIIVS